MDNNSKSDRRTSELWRFSRTTASPAAITKSLDLKKKENIEIQERENYGGLRYYCANFCTAEFHAKYANPLKWDTRKKMGCEQCVTFLILHRCFAFSCFFIYHRASKSATRSRVNPSRQANGLRQMSLTCYIFSFAMLNLCGLRKEKFAIRISISHITVI